MRITLLFCSALIFSTITVLKAQHVDYIYSKTIGGHTYQVYSAGSSSSGSNIYKIPARPAQTKNYESGNSTQKKNTNQLPEKHETRYYIMVDQKDENGDVIKDENGNTLKKSIPYFFPKGSSYIGGTTSVGVPNGEGIMTMANGTTQEGIWENGRLIEEKEISIRHLGEFEISDNMGKINSYLGDLNVNNLPDGRGTYTWGNGMQYSGEWKKGKRHGSGKMYLTPNKYINYVDGEWSDDKFIYGGWVMDDRKLHGSFENDLLSGRGEVTMNTGQKLVAFFENGKPVTGIETWPNGIKYEGTFNSEWQREGVGIYTESTGNFYAGNYKRNVMEGYGKYYDAKGALLNEGLWQNDKFISPRKQVVAKIEEFVAAKQKEIILQNNLPKKSVRLISSISSAYQTSPAKMFGTKDWKYIACGSGFMFAIKKDGTAWAWGKNDDGLLGIGNKINQDTAVLIPAIKSIKTISCEFDFIVALDEHGTASSWGHGYLGIGPFSPYGNRWASISAGTSHLVLINKEGMLWTSGENWLGQLGIEYNLGKSGDAGTQEIDSQNDWEKAFAGDNSSFAIKKDGSLWAWGENDDGQLGIGSFVNVHSPVLVGSRNDNWQDVSCTRVQTLALKKDGTIWCFGLNYGGTMGNGKINEQSIPVQVGTDNDWSLAEAGDRGNFAIKKNGTLWLWGTNDNVGIGSDYFIDQNSPVQIGKDNDWKMIKQMRYHDNNHKIKTTTIGLKNDGSIWAWVVE